MYCFVGHSSLLFSLVSAIVDCGSLYPDCLQLLGNSCLLALQKPKGDQTTCHWGLLGAQHNCTCHYLLPCHRYSKNAHRYFTSKRNPGVGPGTIYFYFQPISRFPFTLLQMSISHLGALQDSPIYRKFMLFLESFWKHSLKVIGKYLYIPRAVVM